MCAEKSNVVTKATFLKLFADAWRHGMTEENVLSAFRCTGISPFNPSIIPPRAFTHVELDPQEARSESVSVQVTPTMDLSRESDAPGGFYLGQRLLTQEVAAIL